MASSIEEPAAGGPPVLEAAGTPERLLDGLVESSPTGIGIISVHENRYLRANAALLELFGRSQEEVLGTDPFTLALRISHPDDLMREQKLFAELAVGATPSYRLEKRVVRPDGSLRWVLAALTGVFDPPVDPATPPVLRSVILQLVDITELVAQREALQRREAELRHAQRVDALGRLAAGIAHDFNNLLTVITGHAEVLKELAPPAAPGARDLTEDLGAILAAADRAAGLTAQLLTHGRRERSAPRTFVLSELVETLRRLLQRTLGSNLEIESALGARGAILADQGQVGQVVMNLMLNARDALSEGGTIRLETHDVVGAPDEPPGLGEWVALIVSDTGHGMTAEVQARIFEPFFTTRAERPGMQGNGLGLATVQRIVRDARGHIAVQSAPGQGTRISVFFPRVAPSPAREPSLPPPQPRPAPNSRRILVIEDDPPVRALVGGVLLGAHYRVSVARDGAEGLHMLDAEGDPVHLVVTDLVMPRIGGVALAERLKQRAASPRVLFISGYSLQSPAELQALGSFLAKPFTPAQLLAAVAQVLEEGEADAGAAPLSAR